MRKWMVEAAIGFIPVLLLFLAIVGYNVVPLVILFVLFGVLFAAIKMRGGGIAIGAAQERKRRQRGPDKLTFEEIGGQESAKQELREALDFMVRHEEISKFDPADQGDFADRTSRNR